MKYYIYSHILFVVGVITAWFLGGPAMAFAVFILAVLEVSLSFDNAVVNAKVLKTMEPVWQDRFIKYGIPIAVFGMRGLFPILIVMVATSMSLPDVFNMAVNQPEEYHKALEANEVGIFLFGGSFLMLVGLSFFLDDEKTHHWFFAEKYVTFLEKGKYCIVISISTFAVYFSGVEWSINAFAYTYGGILLFWLIDHLDSVLSTNGVRYGIIGFLYLEVLDASFSFDGVITAFAITSNIFVIAAGLGIGAMYIRSMTLDFVKSGTLDEYRYLEHGAMYSILFLSIIMLAKIFIDIPDMVTSSIAIVLVGAGFWHSHIVNKAENDNAETTKK